MPVCQRQAVMSNITPLTMQLPSVSGHQQQWGDIAGLGAAFAIMSCAQQQHQPVLVITPDMVSAAQLQRELAFVNPRANTLPILLLPDWEILPYDQFSPHHDIISERLRTFHALTNPQSAVVVVPINTLMHRCVPRQHFDAHVFIINIGSKIAINQFRERLTHAGYRATGQVYEHGEFSIRGSIIDLFPMGSAHPYRIDLFDDEVDSIRIFDHETQCSLTQVQELHLLPAHEYPLTEAGITHFRQNWREQFSGNPARSPLYQAISEGFSAPGIEYYLPLFFNELQTLFDYLPIESLIFSLGDITPPAELFWREVNERYTQLNCDLDRPILPPSAIITTVDELFGLMKPFKHIKLSEQPVTPQAGRVNLEIRKPPTLKIDPHSTHPLAELASYLQITEAPVLFVAESAGRREVLIDLLNNINIKPKTIDSIEDFDLTTSNYCVVTAPLFRGAAFSNPPLIILTEGELFGEQVLQQRRRTKRGPDPDTLIRNLTELHIGAPIVHLDHGVGRYLGLQIIETGGIAAEYLTIEYSDQNKLYVPVASLHLISRYTGSDSDHAPLYALGTQRWQKAKRKAAEQARDVAAELLDIYARRASKSRDSYTLPSQDYASFVAEFPFEETPDQQQAIQAVLTDLTTDKPMDRLVCGDVGFGKTEVAMRATFIVATQNKQVAVLVPTTLLADQHFTNFRDRFAATGLMVEMLSRFRNAKEQKEIMERLAAGKIDIIIGTHKLIQSDIQFHNLGLLIIDEEQRFGVQQKERIKSLRANIDILTLTATPIPRTLNMAMARIRDLSIIATPPARRLAINTFVREFNPALIREALLREILRGGQVYYLHNDVKSIARVAQDIETLVPEAKTIIAHGQMPERQLEKVMIDFYHRRFNVLVCTTIIESGIDIPTANTIIINRADKFGLSQLHQIRGRVGRSHHQAYAYLLTPPADCITRDAEKRLDAIASLDELGAGFALATHDLEIRGAGEILGESQSGQINEVGFSLYMELLENAVEAMQTGREVDLDVPLHHGPEIDLGISALIPEHYVPDINIRLTLYKRMASCETAIALQEFQVELIDRFGLLPLPLQHLIEITHLKLRANQLRINKIVVAKDSGRLELSDQPRINIDKLVELVQTKSTQYRLDGKQRVRFFLKNTDAQHKIDFVKNLLHTLTPDIN